MKKLLWTCLSIAWLALTPVVSLADVTASILGTVTDASGGVIQGARVTATNLDLNLVVAASSDENGHFRILALPVGRYRLGTSFAGFRTSLRRASFCLLTISDGSTLFSRSARPSKK